MKKNVYLHFAPVIMTLGLLLILTGCTEILEPPAPAKTETAKTGLLITVSDGTAARTLSPKTFPTVDKYILYFEEEGGETYDDSPLTITGGSTLLDNLPGGEWTITVEGYSGTVIVAKGTGTIDYTEGDNETLPIYVYMVSDAGNGTLYYDVAFDDTDIFSATLSYRSFPTGSINETVVNLLNDPRASITPLPSGNYLVTVILQKTDINGPYATDTEIVHIFSEMTTEYELTFDDDDFTTAGTPTTYTVTFNLNHSDATGASTVPAPIPTTTGSITLPTTPPTRSGGWAAGMTFDGWYLADGTTQFTGSGVTGDIEVFAHWRFKAGTPAVVGETLVIVAPETTSNSGDNDPDIQGEWNGTTNADGSVSWTVGAARFVFPVGYYEAYDLLDLEYVATGLAGGTVLKEGETATNYDRRDGGPYAHPYGASGTLRFNISVQTSVSLQIYDEALAGANSSIKWTKATFSKAPDPYIPNPVNAGEDYTVKIEGLNLKNTTATTGNYNNLWFSLAEAFPVGFDIEDYATFTIRAKFFMADGTEIPAANGLGQAQFATGTGTANGPFLGAMNSNLSMTTVKKAIDFDVNPTRLYVQNSSATVAFIEITEITFHVPAAGGQVITDPEFTRNNSTTSDSEGFWAFDDGGLLSWELPAAANDTYSKITVFYTIKDLDLDDKSAQYGKLIFKPAISAGSWTGIIDNFQNVADGNFTWSYDLPLTDFNFLGIQDNTEPGVTFKLKITKIEFE
jgi:hypothetical protein